MHVTYVSIACKINTLILHLRPRQQICDRQFVAQITSVLTHPSWFLFRPKASFARGKALIIAVNWVIIFYKHGDRAYRDKLSVLSRAGMHFTIWSR